MTEAGESAETIDRKGGNREPKRWSGVPFTSVEIRSAFWRPRLENVMEVTVPVCLDQCEKTGRIDNFSKAAGRMPGAFEGMYYNDSDVYKVIEGAAYTLMLRRDEALEARLDAIIGEICGAQESDGYLSTYFTLQAPELKWTDMEKHEMYNGGHLIEAAVAYFEATGKKRLLDAACRLADHYGDVFGPGKRHWAEGHEEIELALVKLHGATGEERYWKLALWLLEERGHGHGRGEIWDKPDWGPAYCQDDVPVREIEKVTGHAVRAMYLYTAMADAARVSGEADYVGALERVWHHTTERNMYLTGGIGPSVHNEGFTHDYDLPSESAYCETCAAIAMAFWNHRMNLLLGEGRYADLVETEMYNGALSGISLSGDRFFYVNPLASKGDHHRVEWFHTSCCPTNLVRFLPAVGQYAYARTEDGIAVNQYIGGTAELEIGGGKKVSVTQTTNYPWDGVVELTVAPGNRDETTRQDGRTEKFSLRLRLPGWCRSYKLYIGDRQVPALPENGYLVLDRAWSAGETVRLELDMPVEIVRARPEAEENRGRIALRRGPIVYTLEQTDNPGLDYDGFEISPDAPVQTEFAADLLGGVNVLTIGRGGGRSYRLIPYYAWDNREPGWMQVWTREEPSRGLYYF
ncbi:glycoside hydrolase family 127 protein [Saccharibacillus sp. CPCC 101409]|uniref:glycoside hydrolase family 127 protein n=1 Tax=Saccharibacillus sp. CPCC 101409 TaxID=3058041 RepID=UPI002672E154|nr:beta-L-arabinofuranosidase domain-containing protein [Saccharibacillus sp. CPCC 101409]MDO3409270.1 glycoside hydrolase family 127 protein [Saccharibacillus sp. CPCC 101409]